MKKCLIVPYFGKFPNYFQLTLDSCGKNLDFDWLIITDNNEDYDYPSNVKVYKMTFEEFKKLIQIKLKNYIEKIELEKPYKLCDYKVTYGYVLSAYLKNYDWWGYCDFDIIFGKLNNFITDELLKKYDKLFVFGHFTLYRNTEEINKLFLKSYGEKKLYEEYFKTSKICAFDELWKESINNIFEKNYKKIFYENFSADIYPKDVNFRIIFLDILNKKIKVQKTDKGFFVYDNGKIIKILKNKNEIIKQEYMYIHLQKRKMECNISTLNRKFYKIIPNIFENMEINLEELSYNNFFKIKKRKIDKEYYNKGIIL